MLFSRKLHCLSVHYLLVLEKSEGTKKNNNLETQATLDTRHETKKNKRRRKKCDIDYMSVQ
jgi:hypothetical protein